jgi:hypothetical protein
MVIDILLFLHFCRQGTAAMSTGQHPGGNDENSGTSRPSRARGLQRDVQIPETAGIPRFREIAVLIPEATDETDIVKKLSELLNETPYVFIAFDDVVFNKRVIPLLGNDIVSPVFKMKTISK